MNSFVEAIGLLTQVFAFAGLLAFIAERLVEQFIKPLLQAANFTAAVSAYPGLVLGCLFSVAFNIDLLTPVAVNIGLDPLVSWAGVILTGLIVGGGSNFLHDVWPAKKPTTQR